MEKCNLHKSSKESQRVVNYSCISALKTVLGVYDNLYVILLLGKSLGQSGKYRFADDFHASVILPYSVVKARQRKETNLRLSESKRDRV